MRQHVSCMNFLTWNANSPLKSFSRPCIRFLIVMEPMAGERLVPPKLCTVNALVGGRATEKVKWCFAIGFKHVIPCTERPKNRKTIISTFHIFHPCANVGIAWHRIKYNGCTKIQGFQKVSGTVLGIVECPRSRGCTLYESRGAMQFRFVDIATSRQVIIIKPIGIEIVAVFESTTNNITIVVNDGSR